MLMPIKPDARSTWARRWVLVAGLGLPHKPFWLWGLALSALAALPVCMGLAWLGLAWRPTSAGAWLLFVLWQPVLEEFCFRGLLQGELASRERWWGARHWGAISGANVLTTVAFVAAHLVHQPLAWALLVALPSLVLGYWRDRSGSIWPGVLLHSLYNGCFGLTACLAWRDAGF